MPHEWSQDDVAELVRLRGMGLSAGKISQVFGTNGIDVSRNAVIGKLHRLGSSRPDYIVTRAARKKIAKRRAARLRREGRFLRRPQSLSERILMMPHDPLPEDDAAPPGATSLLDTHEHQCRWPYGTHDYTFCPRRKLPGLPYCEAHTRKGYRVEEIVQRGHPKMAEKFDTVVERETV